MYLRLRMQIRVAVSNADFISAVLRYRCIDEDSSRRGLAKFYSLAFVHVALQNPDYHTYWKFSRIP